MQCIIQTPTPNLNESLSFYRKLGFQTLQVKPFPLLTDGTVVIRINDDNFARAGIRLKKRSWKEELLALAEHGKLFKTETSHLCL